MVQGGLVGRFSRLVGEGPLCVIGLFCVAAGALVTAGSARLPLLTILVVGGAIHAFGRSLFQPSISALVSRNSPEALQGTSLGLYQGVGTLGRVVGPVIAGLVYENHMTLPWVVGALLLVIAAIWMLRLRLPADVSVGPKDHSGEV